jgi:hypothetical protein
MNGIEDFILKDSNTIGGVDKSLAQNYWYRSIKTSAGDTALTSAIIRKPFTATQKNAKYKFRLLTAKHEVVDSFENTLQDTKRYNTEGFKFEGYAAGYTNPTLSFDGDPMIKDRFATTDTLYGYDPDAFDKLVSQPWQFLDGDGSMFKWQGGYKYDVLTSEFCQLALVRNNGNFVITDIATDAA